MLDELEMMGMMTTKMRKTVEVSQRMRMNGRGSGRENERRRKERGCGVKESKEGQERVASDGDTTADAES